VQLHTLHVSTCNVGIQIDVIVYNIAIVQKFGKFGMFLFVMYEPCEIII